MSAGRGTRTLTGLLPLVFETNLSTISAPRQSLNSTLHVIHHTKKFELHAICIVLRGFILLYKIHLHFYVSLIYNGLHLMKVSEFYKKEGIIKVSPQDTLTSVIHKLNSSHDSAFVEENGQLLGVVTPYFAVIKKNNPPNTNVSRCLVTPPKLSLDDDVERVARLMMESKMHFLPVYDERKWVGVVSARRLLSVIINDPVFKTVITDTVGQRQSLVTITEDDTVAQAAHAFKEYAISKLVVVGERLELKGILSQYDLIDFLITPRDRQTSGKFGGEKVAQNSATVRNFYKTNVLTAPQHSTYEQIVKLIIDKHKGSVVVVDTSGRPVEIVTIYDILSKLLSPTKIVEIETNLTHVEEKHNAQVDKLLPQLSHHLKHLKDIRGVSLSVGEQKHGGVIEIKLNIRYGQNRQTVIEKTGKNFPQVASQIIKAVRSLTSKQ